jgi:hypothetical protein
MLPRGQISSLTSLFLQKLGQSEPEIVVTILSPSAFNDPDDPNIKIVSLFAGVFALSGEISHPEGVVMNCSLANAIV